MLSRRTWGLYSDLVKLLNQICAEVIQQTKEKVQKTNNWSPGVTNDKKGQCLLSIYESGTIESSLRAYSAEYSQVLSKADALSYFKGNGVVTCRVMYTGSCTPHKLVNGSGRSRSSFTPWAPTIFWVLGFHWIGPSFSMHCYEYLD